MTQVNTVTNDDELRHKIRELAENKVDFDILSHYADIIASVVTADRARAVLETEIRLYVDMLDYYVTDTEVRKQLEKKLSSLQNERKSLDNKT